MRRDAATPAQSAYERTLPWRQSARIMPEGERGNGSITARTTVGAGNDSDKVLCESNTGLLRYGAVIRMVARYREVRPMKGAARVHGAGIGQGCGPSAAQSIRQIGHDLRRTFIFTSSPRINGSAASLYCRRDFDVIFSQARCQPEGVTEGRC